MKLLLPQHWNRQASASVGLLVLLILVGLLLLAVPWRATLNAYNFELQRDARQLQHLLAVEAVRPELERIDREFHERGLHGWVYDQSSASAIQLDIQRRVTEILMATGADLNTVALLAMRSREGDDFVTVGVRVRFSGSLDQVFASFQQFEQSTPLLLIEETRMAPLAVRSPRGSGMLQSLDVQLSLSVLMPAASVPGHEQGAW